MSTTVKLLTTTADNPLFLITHAAQTCYQAQTPKWGNNMDVEKVLFNTGHHTTLQHFYFTFAIENIPVSDITFGLHLVSPFYNSDQRSGRFCGTMFENPDYPMITELIRERVYDLSEKNLNYILDYVKLCTETYQNNLQNAIVLTKNLLKTERPMVSDEYITQNAPKIAQEQLRMIIPIVYPTGIDFTINLSTLVALYRSAWSPGVRLVVNQMVKQVLELYPVLNFMFDQKSQRQTDFNPMFVWCRNLITAPLLDDIQIFSPFNKCMILEAELYHPVDLGHFMPEAMVNNITNFIAQVEISVATMGQDQRHRTISRSEPYFTGDFYLSPILNKLGIENEVKKIINFWNLLFYKVPPSIQTLLAPYGAMVSYYKRGNINALLHEQAKRLCWCAQQEIYNLSVFLRRALLKNNSSLTTELVDYLAPVCYKTGKCLEGKRYCGRNIKNRRQTEEYFPERQV